MKSMSLYVHRDSPVHRIDPITKIFYAVAAAAIPFILPSRAAAIVTLVFSVCLLTAGKVMRKVVPLIGFSFVVLLSVVIIQGLFRLDNKTQLFTIGPLTFYREGLLYALAICFRVLNILSAFSILVLTTKPSELIESLVRNGLSPRIGYVLSSVLQIIPEMTSTMGTVMDAQKSRGMETEGNIFVRVRAFFPLIGPVVMSSLVSTRERAMALEVRGFNSRVKKTFLSEEVKSPYSKPIQWCLVLLVVLSVVWRILL